MRLLPTLALAASMIVPVAAAHAAVGVYVNVGPRNVQYIPPSPEYGYVWVPGYYEGSYWVEGRWAAPGYYGGHYYTEGYRDSYRRDRDRDRDWDRHHDWDRHQDRDRDRDWDHDRDRHHDRDGWRR